MFPALRYHDFRLVLGGTFLSYVAAWMQRLLVGWLMLTLTGSPTLVAAAFAARSLPNLILGAFGGTIADRVNRKHLIITVQAILGLLSLMMSVLVLTLEVSPWQVIVFSFCFGTAQSFDLPARQALVYDVTSRQVLMNALSLNEIGRRLTGVLAPLVGGLLIEAVGIGRVLLVMAAASILGMATIIPVQASSAHRLGNREPVIRSLIEGARVIAGNQVTATLLLLAMLCEILGFSFSSMMPVFAGTVLQLPASGYGYLEAAFGVGMAAGVTTLALLGESRRKGWLFSGAFLLFGAFLLMFSLSTWFSVSLLLLIGVGMMASAFDTLEHTLLQGNVPEQMRGRVIGAWVLSIGMGPVGMMYLGFLAERLGAPLGVGLNAMLLTLTALGVLIGLPRVRRLR